MTRPAVRRRHGEGARRKTLEIDRPEAAVAAWLARLAGPAAP